MKPDPASGLWSPVQEPPQAIRARQAAAAAASAAGKTGEAGPGAAAAASTAASNTTSSTGSAPTTPATTAPSTPVKANPDSVRILLCPLFPHSCQAGRRYVYCALDFAHVNFSSHSVSLTFYDFVWNFLLV